MEDEPPLSGNPIQIYIIEIRGVCLHPPPFQIIIIIIIIIFFIIIIINTVYIIIKFIKHTSSNSLSPFALYRPTDYRPTFQSIYIILNIFLENIFNFSKRVHVHAQMHGSRH